MSSRRTVKPLRLSLGEDSLERAKEAAFASKTSNNLSVDLNRLRGIVKASLGKNLFDNAIFFANKLVTLSGGSPADVHLLAQAYYLGKQFRRAVHLIQQHGFLTSVENRPPSDNNNNNASGSNSSGNKIYHNKKFLTPKSTVNLADIGIYDENISFVLLAVQCLIESSQYEEAQSVLEGVLGELDIDTLIKRSKMVEKNYNSFDHYSGSIEQDLNPIAALCLLRAKVYETLDNRPRASDWYKMSLYCDIYCYEAFNALIDNQLRPSEERQMMSDLKRYGAFDGVASWLEPVYSSRLSKHDYSKPVENRFQILENIVADPKSKSTQSSNIDLKRHNLGHDLDCAADKAECLYQQHDAQGAYQVTRQIRFKDPYHLRCITVHLASLVELKRKSELFHTAHSLVDSYPKNAVSWFAVGCYYYAISKFDAARRFFHKATTMDPSLAVAWLGFGHSFAAQDESDQAMAAYRTASRLFTGSHLPVLCTAIEYLRTNNVTLAEQFCRQAKSMCATDPLVFNELGVVHYRQQRYQQAIDCFQEALKLCRHQPERLRYAWEPAMFNLGHAYRKLRKYDEAIEYYEKALSYSPKEASTYAALGLTYHLQGRLEEAIQNYHNALGLKPEDTFSGEMLDKALTESYTNPQFSIDFDVGESTFGPGGDGGGGVDMVVDS